MRSSANDLSQEAEAVEGKRCESICSAHGVLAMLVGRSTWRLVILAAGLLFVLGALATLVKARLNPALEDFKGEGERLSWTIAEAKRRGTLVSELQPDPRKLPVGDKTIEFHEAWLEERSLPRHVAVWFPAEKRVGGYNLCFTLDSERDVAGSDWFFVADDEKGSVSARSTRDSRTLYTYRLTAPDLSDLRLSLLSSWEDKRLKNIRFTNK